MYIKTLIFLFLGIIIGAVGGATFTEKRLEKQFDVRVSEFQKRIDSQKLQIQEYEANKEKNVRLVIGHNESCVVSVK